MMPCPNCGTQYDAALAACPNCQTAAEAPVRCERCAHEYVGADACPACGWLRADLACENHPAHRASGRCVLCGRVLCPECAHEGKHLTLCEQHRDTTVIEGWAQVYSTTSEVEAQLLRDNLRAEGIDAQVYSQKDMMFTVDLGELSIVRLLVPVWEFEQALQVIRDHMDVQGEVAFACSACGEPFEPGTRECLACGAALV